MAAVDFYIDPWVGQKAAEDERRYQEAMSNLYEQQQDRKINREILDYKQQKQEELDQYMVPLAKMRAQAELAKNQDQFDTFNLDMQANRQMQQMVTPDGKIIDPMSNDGVTGLMQLAQDAAQNEKYRLANIYNSRAKNIAAQLIPANINNPAEAYRLANIAGFDNTKMIENLDGTFTMITKDLAGKDVKSTISKEVALKAAATMANKTRASLYETSQNIELAKTKTLKGEEENALLELQTLKAQEELALYRKQAALRTKCIDGDKEACAALREYNIIEKAKYPNPFGSLTDDYSDNPNPYLDMKKVEKK